MSNIAEDKICKKSDCSKAGEGKHQQHEHKFTESHLKRLPRAEVLKIVEGIAKNRNEEVPEEIHGLAKTSSKTSKIKKYSMYVFIGIVILLLVLSLITPAAPIGGGLLAGIVAGGGVMEVLAPLLLIIPGFVAGGAKIRGNAVSKENKRKMIQYALQLQQRDPELYQELNNLGEMSYNNIIQNNNLEDVIASVQNQNPLTQNQLSRFQEYVAPDFVLSAGQESPAFLTPKSVVHSNQ